MEIEYSGIKKAGLLKTTQEIDTRTILMYPRGEHTIHKDYNYYVYLFIDILYTNDLNKCSFHTDNIRPVHKNVSAHC